uniref:Uncharacterized protein n=1 Tax=Arundo donax TaxID=35708 RepID=A0A0A9F1X2_ARUDO
MHSSCSQYVLGLLKIRAAVGPQYLISSVLCLRTYKCDPASIC